MAHYITGKQRRTKSNPILDEERREAEEYQRTVRLKMLVARGLMTQEEADKQLKRKYHRELSPAQKASFAKGQVSKAFGKKQARRESESMKVWYKKR
ncbi:hypothetical protein [Lacticaseibacillus jixiensis]|uniref:hypothetical protein n=1 Tax=Lacticaseibacillus jixiensis TaxID=3231926 RepID=UPI0036F3FE37